MIDDDPISVHLDIRSSDGVVSVQKLLDLPGGGFALVDGEEYIRIGQVYETRRAGRRVWAWNYDEKGYGREGSTAATKKAALDALLEAGGYVIAPPNAINPGMFT